VGHSKDILNSTPTVHYPETEWRDTPIEYTATRGLRHRVTLGGLSILKSTSSKVWKKQLTTKSVLTNQGYDHVRAEMEGYRILVTHKFDKDRNETKAYPSKWSFQHEVAKLKLDPLEMELESGGSVLDLFSFNGIGGAASGLLGIDDLLRKMCSRIPQEKEDSPGCCKKLLAGQKHTTQNVLDNDKRSKRQWMKTLENFDGSATMLAFLTEVVSQYMEKKMHKDWWNGLVETTRHANAAEIMSRHVSPLSCDLQTSLRTNYDYSWDANGVLINHHPAPRWVFGMEGSLTLKIFTGHGFSSVTVAARREWEL